jgi:hypothetical protein
MPIDVAELCCGPTIALTVRASCSSNHMSSTSLSYHFHPLWRVS